MSSRSASLVETSRITARNLSAITWMRGWLISGQASAEPTIGPTRLARSRTTLTLSPGVAAPAAPASKTQNSAIAQRADGRNFIPARSDIVMLLEYSGFTDGSGLLSPLHELLQQPF